MHDADCRFLSVLAWHPQKAAADAVASVLINVLERTVPGAGWRATEREAEKGELSQERPPGVTQG